MGVVRAAFRPLRPVRDRVNRLLHPLRRRRALRTVRSRLPIRVVVFVCLGNICRSPYAAARLRQLARDRGVEGLEIRSAGFIGPDRESPPEARSVALEMGVDLSRHRSRLVDEADVDGSDLVLVMTPSQRSRLVREFGRCGEQVVVLGDLDPEPASSRGIPDPWGKSREVFNASFQRIDRCLEDAIALIEPRGARDVRSAPRAPLG